MQGWYFGLLVASRDHSAADALFWGEWLCCFHTVLLLDSTMTRGSCRQQSLAPQMLILPVPEGLWRELMNFSVVKASTARETFEKIKSERPDLIILDIHLPGLNGIEICDVLQKDPATANIPVIFLTADSDELTEMSAKSAGAFSFLLKPLDPAVFQTKVHEALSRSET